jgi:hypothetical protein
MTNYHPDWPPFDQRPTSGQLPVVSRPLGTVPLAPPPPATVHPHLAHPPHIKRSPVDQLASHSQRMIKKYADEIYQALVPQCTCDDCKSFLTTELADLISEVLTDQTILTLSIQRVERSINRLADNVEVIVRSIK